VLRWRISVGGWTGVGYIIAVSGSIDNLYG
jgi:hypothetical protein